MSLDSVAQYVHAPTTYLVVIRGHLPADEEGRRVGLVPVRLPPGPNQLWRIGTTLHSRWSQCPAPFGGAEAVLRPYFKQFRTNDIELKGLSQLNLRARR